MITTLVAVSWILIIATVLPFVRRGSWWIRFFDFPRSQITVLGIGCLTALLWQWDRSIVGVNATIGVLFVSTVYQGWELLTYTKFRRVQSLLAESSDPQRRIRFLIANVLMTNHNVDQTLKVIQERNPDIIALAEPDHYWEERLRVIEQEYKYSIKCPIENTYGMLLYSKLRLTEEQIRFRVEQDIPSFTCCVQLRTGDLFELHCIHPKPPQVGQNTENRDAELVLVAREVKDRPLPVIVTGDLNDVAWSHTTRLFLRISGLLDPRVGRMFCNTFHANYFLFRWPLDHLFHSRAFRLVRLERLERTDSDHFPVLVELSYEPERRIQQERPLPEEDDMEESQRKIDRAIENGTADPGTEIEQADTEAPSRKLDR